LEQVKIAIEVAAIGPDVGMNLAILNDTDPIPLKKNLNGFTFIRSQIPVKPVFGGTVDHSQGMTLSKAIIDCRTKFWEHGQLYVTLSRVRSPENICVLLPADLTDFSLNPPVDQKVAEILEAIDNGMDRDFLSDVEDLGAEISTRLSDSIDRGMKTSIRTWARRMTLWLQMYSLIVWTLMNWTSTKKKTRVDYWSPTSPIQAGSTTRPPSNVQMHCPDVKSPCNRAP
jgi:hypothetical protein